MLKNKYLTLLMLAIIPLLVTACDDDDKGLEPTFSQIVITPAKDVYKVGDQITCSINRTSPGTGDLRDASYWWYASWWFDDSEMKADFQEFDASDVCTSSTITLTEAGEVTLYFFGRLDYPHYDKRKVEIAKTITVTE